ncbi:MAG: FIST N-terminal domain-containing protein [Pseudomonadota bacterium]
MRDDIESRLDCGAGSRADRTVVRTCSTNPDTTAAFAEIAAGFEGRDLGFVLLFVSPKHDRDAIVDGCNAHLSDTQVLGCTTAGELGPDGYQHGSIVALGFPRSNFVVRTHLIQPVSEFSLDQGSTIASDLMRPDGLEEAALWDHRFALLFIDGLARREDAVVAALAPSLGGVPLIGGSAGDGLDFGQTFVIHGGRFHADAAVLAIVHTNCPIKGFRLDNFVPTDHRMVVTGADPAERLVTEINVEPAAREYARIVGKDPEQLSPFIFAENPVVVRVGGEHFCRSIQKVEDNGDLRFYCAIDEGLVLTVARSTDIVAHLDENLEALAEKTPPDLVLGFDCVLRRLDVETSQKTREMSRVLARHGVMGFNTYGEQYRGMHVNQTFTGVAVYPSDARLDD